MTAIPAAVKADNRRLLERVRIPFLYVLPTAKHPVRCHQNRILREKHGHSGGVVPVVCLVQPPINFTELIKCLGNPEEITLLDYSLIGCVLLLGEGRQSKAERIFIVPAGVLGWTCRRNISKGIVSARN
jgi:hypothetical protein